jgi:hypothetical protein
MDKMAKRHGDPSKKGNNTEKYGNGPVARKQGMEDAGKA